ncbi:MAG: glycosyltransferase [Methanothrix sp.]|nr:glycosyltransferase [Methanothrix sp.]
MRVLLLSNQPERTTRLGMFRRTLERLGYDVRVPKFSTRSWIGVAREAREALRRERPEVLHIFNVPDIIYHGLPSQRGSCYRRLIYDYRSPWGVELQMTLGPPARPMAEHFERELARSADAVTSVNQPLAEKARSYIKDGRPIFIIPNYPSEGFLKEGLGAEQEAPDEGALIFIGRISRQEGVGNLLRLIREIPERTFWIIGDGPFSGWYLRDLPANARFMGWQPHDRVAGLIRMARLCLIPHSETLLTPYATDRSVWKLNEYLALGKMVVASGVTLEERRKNLSVVKTCDLKCAVLESLGREPERLGQEDYRLWEMNEETIREAYESL